MVWCGARNGRQSTNPPPGCAPATPWIRVTSMASWRLSDGRIDGRRRASIVLPVPGGPDIRRLWPPAAAMTSARIGPGWPRTSRRSGGSSARGAGSGFAAGVARRLGILPTQDRHDGPQVGGRRHDQPLDQARLGRILGRDHDPLEAGARRALRDGQRSARGPQLAAERQLAEDGRPSQRIGRRLAGGRQDPAGDREVEAGADLVHVRGREVDHHPSRGELELRVEHRRADPLARLAHGAVAQPDDRERGQPGADVDLDGDAQRVHPADRESGGAGEHGGDAKRGPVPQRVRLVEQRRRLRARRRATAEITGSPAYGRHVTDARQHLGRLGEQLALEHLERLGYELVARNHRTRFGELDLVVSDGRTLVFVEVKARRADRPGRPWESLHPRKRDQVRRMAAAFLAENGDRPRTADAAVRRHRGDHRRPRAPCRPGTSGGGVVTRREARGLQRGALWCGMAWLGVDGEPAQSSGRAGSSGGRQARQDAPQSSR